MVKKLLGGTGFVDQMQGIYYNFDKNDINLCHVMSLTLLLLSQLCIILMQSPTPCH